MAVPTFLDGRAVVTLRVSQDLHLLLDSTLRTTRNPQMKPFLYQDLKKYLILCLKLVVENGSHHPKSELGGLHREYSGPFWYDRNRLILGELKAVSWASTVIALAFLVFRIFVRVKSFKTLYSDDLLVMAAWCMILATSIIWQTQKKALEAQRELAAGAIPQTDDVSSLIQNLQRMQFPIFVLFYCSLWSVKLSFLLFFRRLQEGQTARGPKIWWWCVLSFVIVTWASCVGDLPWRCLMPTNARK